MTLPALLSLLGAIPLLAAPLLPLVTLQASPGGGYLPDAVTAPDGTVHLVVHQGDPAASDLYYTTWSPRTELFSGLVRINSIRGAAIAGGAVRGAHLALGTDDSIHLAWMGSAKTAPEGDHARSPMCYTRSLDGGRSFEAQRNLVTTAYGLDGGGTLAVDRKGNVHVLWHARGAEEGAGQRVVVMASSQDNGKSFAPERTLDTETSGVCPCCGIRAVTSPRGDQCFVLFRAAPQPDERGIRIFSFASATPNPVAHLVHSDSWQIQTCPVSSGSFAFNPTHFAVAWENESRATVGVFDRKSGKLARSLGAPASSTKANQKHPAVALAEDGSLLLAWLEVTGWGRPGTLHWQHLDSTGQPTKLAGSKKLEVPWTRPALATTPTGFVVFH